VDLNWLVQQDGGFPPDEIAALNAGKVISRADVSRDDREAAAVALVRIAVPKERVIDYFRQLVTYVDGEVTLQFGTFSRPPRSADLASLKLDSDDIDALRSCKPGDCDMRLGARRLPTCDRLSTGRHPRPPTARTSGHGRECSRTYPAISSAATPR
jgi:hypothetical protein